MIHLRGTDNVSVSMRKTIAMKMGLFKEMFDDCSQDEEILDVPIKSSILSLVILYYEHMTATASSVRTHDTLIINKPGKVNKPLDTSLLSLDWTDPSISEWETNFIENLQPSVYDKDFKTVTTLWELLEAANFFHAQRLLDVICSKIAFTLKDLTADQMRKLYGIENDLSAEEELQIQKETQWGSSGELN